MPALLTPVVAAASANSDVLVELGAVLLVLAVLARSASLVGIPAVPVFLAVGLVVGDGGVVALDASRDFIRIGSDIGLVMLLFTLGLEYSPEELFAGVKTNWLSGIADFAANFTPGSAAGLLLGWGLTGAVLLGGVTYISSSGIIAKQIADLERFGNRETPVILSILVLEDLAMALYLPLLGVLLIGVSPLEGTLSVGTALVVVAVSLYAAWRHGATVSKILDTGSSELLLLTIFGLTLAVAGVAEDLKVSAAVGAFLVGLALSGAVAERTRELLMPVRHVFSGLFFLFFGIRIDPATLPPVLPAAAALALITAVTKMGTGWWAALRTGIGPRGRVRAATSLIARGEFSIVLGGLAVAAGLDGEVGALIAAYVMVLAIGGSLAMRYSDRGVS